MNTYFELLHTAADTALLSPTFQRRYVMERMTPQRALKPGETRARQGAAIRRDCRERMRRVPSRSGGNRTHSTGDLPCCRRRTKHCCGLRLTDQGTGAYCDTAGRLHRPWPHWLGPSLVAGTEEPQEAKKD